jgi:hypothetical protein
MSNVLLWMLARANITVIELSINLSPAMILFIATARAHQRATKTPFILSRVFF